MSIAIVTLSFAGTCNSILKAVFMESKIYPLRKNQTKGSEELFKLIAKVRTFLKVQLVSNL